MTFFFVGNLLLTDVYERYYVDLEYGEEYRGVYLIRGENVVLVGELVRETCNKTKKLTSFLQDEDEFQAISKRMAKFKRPLDVILPKFKALNQKISQTRLRLDQLGLSELIENDNY